MHPLRVRIDGAQSFPEFLSRVQADVLDMYEHRNFTFGSLLEKLKFRRDASRNPLFSVQFNFEAEKVVREFADLEVKVVTARRSFEVHELAFNLAESETAMELRLWHNSQLWDEETALRWARCYETLLYAIAADADRALTALDLMPEDERRRLLTDWSTGPLSTVAGGGDRSGDARTNGNRPAPRTIHGWFEQREHSSGESVAAEFPDPRSGRSTKLTYSELNARSNRLAHHLRRRGVGAEDRVALFVDRSPQMLVGLLGILKAGCAYVPLDPWFPQERTLRMLEDSGARIVLTQESVEDRFPAAGAEVIRLDRDSSAIESERADPPDVEVDPDRLAYVIYTSGSTGDPKGVQISHRSVVNLLSSMAREPGFGEDDVLLAVTTISFDIAALELFLPLVSGGKVVVASREQAMDGHRLSELLRRFGVTVLQATPATWRLLLTADWRGRRGLKALCGGETLPEDLAAQLLTRCGSLWNMYGPTETTIWSTTSRIEPAARVTIGRPIAGTRIYILDSASQPVPVGVPGELHIGGLGLSRGYLNRPDLTAERFIADPFSDGSRERMYRTGDLARYLADGDIELLGRIDHQVKIRGFRIELGEVESVLSAHPSVEEAVVLAREDEAGEKTLVAYVTSPDSTPPAAPELQRHLARKLPSYMLPSAYVMLDELPLTPNAKIDRAALPAPGRDGGGSTDGYVAPRDALELNLVKVWETTLARRPISVRDDFFEIGGHSLLAARLFSRLDRALGIKLPLATLFQASTVEQLAEALRSAEWSPTWTSLVPIQPGGSRAPLYCVHGAAGNVLLYRELARRLGPEQPLYGLQARGLDGSEPCLTTLEEMAARYIGEIKTLQPEGPYFLGGYCLGGTIADEMARQMHDQGDEVGFVFLFETYNMKAVPFSGSGLRRVSNAWQNVRFHFSNLGLLGKSGKISFLREKARVALWRTRQLLLSPVIRAALKLHVLRRHRGLHYVRLARMHDRAQLSYDPGRYPGRVVLFRTNTTFTGFDDPDFGWRDLVGDNLETRVLPFHPKAMLVEPFVEILSKALSGYMEEARREVSAGWLSARASWDSEKWR